MPKKGSSLKFLIIFSRSPTPDIILSLWLFNDMHIFNFIFDSEYVVQCGYFILKYSTEVISSSEDDLERES